MAKRSTWTRLVLEMAAELHEMRHEAERHREVPFMEERIKPSQLRQQLQSASPEERVQIRQRVGQDKLIEVLRRDNAK